MSDSALDIVRTRLDAGRGLYATLFADGKAILIRDEGSPGSPVIWQRGTQPSAKAKAVLDAAAR